MSKILIVDDEKMMLMMARRILSRKYDVITATTGAEAIELFQSERGYELHRILQRISAEPVPIMFMTADDSSESEIKGFEVGAADYIRKPLKPDVLLRRVSNIIDNLDKIHGLETAASTDPLTGLLNKTASQKEIGERVKISAGALLMIDLDSFKLVNDLYGHGIGDKILIHFARLIKEIIRENDLAGRMGGDEFIAFLQNVDDEKILQDKTAYLNEQLLIVAKKFMGYDMQIPLGTSVGAVFVPDEGRDFASLYKKADVALYNVKQHGKHGLAVFGIHKPAENLSVSGLSQLRMILEERNQESGAYFVDFETFKKIYRLMARMADNYQKDLTLMQFTLRVGEFAEEFKTILLKSLRRSDCVSQSGNKFIVLLPETSEKESDDIKNRIFSRLENLLADKISFEREKIS